MTAPAIREMRRAASAPTIPVGAKRFSNLANWAGGVLPGASDDVDLGAGEVWVWDCDVTWKSLTINGTLMDDPAIVSLTMTVGEISDGMGATWMIGRPGRRINGRKVVLNGAKPGSGTSTARTYQFMGTSAFYGTKPRYVRTRLAASVASGDPLGLARDDISDWKAGDIVGLETTDHYGVSSSLKWALPADAGSSIFLFPVSGGAPHSFWGVKQYLQDATFGAGGANAVSLTQPGSVTVPAGYQGKTVIDQSAFLVNYTRGIVFECPEDTHWTTNGYGVATMAHMGGKYQWDGVQINRGGHAGELGAYPTHEHMLSYAMVDMNTPSDGTFIGNVTNAFRRNVSVVDSTNRAFVFHGTCGSIIEDCCAWNIIGMAFFGEDGSERDYVLRRNTVIKVRSIASGSPNLFRDFDRNAAGFWLSNPSGIYQYNHGGDCQHFGEWDSFATQPWGLSANVLRPGGPHKLDNGTNDPNNKLQPIKTGNTPGDREGNTYSSCGDHGINRNQSQTANNGTFATTSYQPNLDPDGKVSFHEWGVEIWKCREAYVNRVMGGVDGYGNIVGGADYQRWVTSDNAYNGLHGSANGIAKHMLLVGYTFNQGNLPSPDGTVGRPEAIASYEGVLMPSQSIIANFPDRTPVFVAPVGHYQGAGGIQMWDAYLSGWLGWMEFATDMVFSNAIFGYKVPTNRIVAEVPAEYSGIGAGLSGDYDWYTGVFHDPLHYMGPYKHWTSKRPFFTEGATFVDCPGTHNGVHVDREFMSVNPKETDTTTLFGTQPFVLDNWKVDRFPDGSLSHTSLDALNKPSHNGELESAVAFTRLANFGVAAGGRYSFSRPSSALNKVKYRFVLNRFTNVSWNIVLDVQWDGTVPVRAPTITRGSTFAAVGGESAVNSATVNSYWQDTSNNKVYMKIFGAPDPSLPPGTNNYPASQSGMDLTIIPV